MLPAIQIYDEDARVTDAETIHTALAQCACRLPGSKSIVWQHPDWRVVEQAYDLPDVYVSYLEISIYTDLATLPIRCARSDLYWLYMLVGQLTISPSQQSTALLREQGGHYRLGYLPSGHYCCRFNAGSHHLFYVVHKPSSLFREESDEFRMEATVFHAVKNQLGTPALTDSLSMSDGSMRVIRLFLIAPGNTSLKRRQTIQYLSLELIFLAHDSFARKADGKTIGAEWAERMRNFIDACIETGEGINALSVSQHFRISFSYARALFKTHSGYSLQDYIRNQKLAHSKKLMDAGSSPTLAASFIGWSYGYYNKAFMKAYGITPREYRRKNNSQ